MPEKEKLQPLKLNFTREELEELAQAMMKPIKAFILEILTEMVTKIGKKLNEKSDN